MLVRTSLAVLALAAATPAPAAPKTLPMLTLGPPAGWVATDVENGVILNRKFSNGGGAIIAVESKPLAGSFDAAFAAAAGGIAALKGEEPFVDQAGESTLGFPMRYEVRCCGDGDVSAAATTVAFNPPGRVVTAALVEIGLGDDDEDAVEAAFAALVESLEFEGFGRRPPVPRPLGYGPELDGFYTHTEMQLRPNPFGGTDFVAQNTTYAFDPSGRFADEPPPPAGSSIEAACAAEPEGCGVYTAIGRRIALKTVSGRFGLVFVETLPFAAGEGTLTLGEREFTAVEPERALVLDGTWTHSFAQSGTTAFSSGSVSSSRTYAFTPDGRFARTGSSGFSAGHDVGDATVRTAGSSGRRPARGTYAIHGFTLTLTEASGTTEALSLYRPDKGDLDLLMIEGDAFLREGRDQEQVR